MMGSPPSNIDEAFRMLSEDYTALQQKCLTLSATQYALENDLVQREERIEALYAALLAERAYVAELQRERAFPVVGYAYVVGMVQLGIGVLFLVDAEPPLTPAMSLFIGAAFLGIASAIALGRAVRRRSLRRAAVLAGSVLAGACKRTGDQ